MNPDKTTPKIGTLLEGNEGRDAIHIAVAPVQAMGELEPGWHVVVEDGRKARMALGDEQSTGIVDPFLDCDVEKGQWFYVFLHPGTITSLRHVFTHPAFVTKVPTDG